MKEKIEKIINELKSKDREISINIISEVIEKEGRVIERVREIIISKQERWELHIYRYGFVKFKKGWVIKEDFYEGSIDDLEALVDIWINFGKVIVKELLKKEK